MRLLVIVLAVISTILALIFSILGNIALIPIIVGAILSFIALKMNQKENKSTGFVKILFSGIIIALAISIYRGVFTENVIEDTQENIEKEKKSEEDALEQLEGIEIED